MISLTPELQIVTRVMKNLPLALSPSVLTSFLVELKLIPFKKPALCVERHLRIYACTHVLEGTLRPSRTKLKNLHELGDATNFNR